eukprot:2364667-Rhodomonas_salina.1
MNAIGFRGPIIGMHIRRGIICPPSALRRDTRYRRRLCCYRSPTRNPVLTYAMLLPGDACADCVSAYARTMQCAVLRCRMGRYRSRPAPCAPIQHYIDAAK